MTTFNSIWATSLNQASILQKSNSKLSLGGIKSASSSSGTGLLGPINMAKGQQGPLDILLSVVGKSVSDVMSAYKPTQGMSFANSFKSAFSLSPFQQTSMNITNSIAATSISNLSKGIFGEATSAMSMSRQEKESLMTTLLSGVNLGFLNSKSLLQSQGLLTEMIHESLNNLQNNVQTNVGGFYDSVMGNSLNIYGTQTNAAIAPPPSTTTPPAVTTPDTTTTVTTPDTTTTASETETPQEDVTESAEEVTTFPAETTPPTTSTTIQKTTTTTASEIETPQTGSEVAGEAVDSEPSILEDTFVQKTINGLENKIVRFGSGTTTGMFENEDFYVIDNKIYSDGQGIGHDISSVLRKNNTALLFDSESIKYVVDGEKVFDSWDKTKYYIDSLSTYNIKDGSGNTHEIKTSLDEKGSLEKIELDGKEMSSNNLLQWAKDNGLEKIEKYGNEEYFAELETPFGSERIKLVAEANGVVANFFKNDSNKSQISWDWDSNVSFFIKDGSGKTYNYSMGNEGYSIDGKNMSSEELVQWAEEKGLEKVTVHQGRDEVEVWYADISTERGNMQAQFAISVNGISRSNETQQPLGNIKTESTDGDINYFTQEHSFREFGYWYSIDGKAVDSSQVVDLIKNSSNFQKTGSLEFDDVEYDIYVGDNKSVRYAIDSSTNQIVVNPTSSYERNIQVAGQSMVQKVLNTYNGTKSYYEVNGNKVSNEQLKEFAVENEVKTQQWVSPAGEQFTEYYDDANGVFLAEKSGEFYSAQEYGVIHRFYFDPLSLDMNGDGIQTVSAEEGVQFDLLGNGQSVQTGWTAGGDDAFLALDRDNSGAIESGKELFGNQWGAANGYEELAKFDDNNDGVIDSRDKVFSNLKLWNDSNMNGVSEAGELRTLAQAGVASISTGFKTSSFVDAAGNQHRQVSSFTKTNGQSAVTTDLWFRYYGITSYINNQYPTAR